METSTARDLSSDDIPPSAPSTSRRTARTSFAGRTDIGKRRSRNEDTFGMFPSLGLFVVADGMGGAAAGEVAASMFVGGLSDRLSRGRHPRYSKPETLIAAVRAVNQEINTAARRNRHLAGMGTTFAALLLVSDGILIAHVGDSRVYRLRAGHLEQLTEDHTLANEYVRAGVLAPERVATFPQRHIITRAIGRRTEVEVDVSCDAPQPGDVYLICSDGLHGEVNDETIRVLLEEQTDLDEAVEHLVDQANARGGSDNITAVVVRWEGPSR
jgi:protein phosphatase